LPSGRGDDLALALAVKEDGADKPKNAPTLFYGQAP